MKILAIIPARGGSKGIKLKNLRKIKGKTLVGHAINCAKLVDLIDNIVVSTDSELIKEEAICNGIDVPFMRPAGLSGDRVSDLPVLKHALLESEKYWKKQFDLVLMLQPTSPLRNHELIFEACRMMQNEDIDSVWSVSQSDSKYHPLKQLKITDKGFLDYFDREGSKIVARQQLYNLYHRNGAVYGFKRKIIIDEIAIKPAKTRYILCDTPQISIDTEFDLELAEFFMNKYQSLYTQRRKNA